MTILFPASCGAGFTIATQSILKHEKGNTEMIYIATDIHGRGVRHVLAFDNRADLYRYAENVIERSNSGDRWPRASYSIDRLCECLYDRGVGFGARSHRRVSRRDAYRLTRDGAERHGF